MAINPHTTFRIARSAGPKAYAERGVRVNPERGFALLIAVIFMSVMLTFGLALGSLAYKQEVIASSAIESQYAFYAADAALECALYQDQRLNAFAYDATRTAPTPTYSCDGSAPLSVPSKSPYKTYSGSTMILSYRFSLDSGKRCADVTVYKPSSASGHTYLFSQGYDVSCSVVGNPGSTSRYVSRGLEANY